MRLFIVALIGFGRCGQCPERVADVLVAKLGEKEAGGSVPGWLKEAGLVMGPCELGQTSVAKIQSAIAALPPLKSGTDERLGLTDRLTRSDALTKAAKYLTAVVGDTHAAKVLDWKSRAWATADHHRGLYCDDPKNFVPAVTADDLLVYLDMVRGCFSDVNEAKSVLASTQRKTRTNAAFTPILCTVELGEYIATILKEAEGSASQGNILGMLRRKRSRPTGCPGDLSDYMAVGQESVSPIVDAVLARVGVEARRAAAAAVLDYLPALKRDGVRPNYLDALQTLVRYNPDHFAKLCSPDTLRMRMPNTGAHVGPATDGNINYLALLVRALETIATCPDELAADNEVRTLVSQGSREARFMAQLSEVGTRLHNTGIQAVEIVAMTQILNALADTTAHILQQLIANAQFERENNDMIEEVLISIADELDIQKRPRNEDPNSHLHHAAEAFKEFGVKSGSG